MKKLMRRIRYSINWEYVGVLLMRLVVVAVAAATAYGLYRLLVAGAMALDTVLPPVPDWLKP